MRCKLPDEKTIKDLAREISEKIDIENIEKYTKDFVPLLILDGMRTGSLFKGKDAYLDGADFGKKFFFIHKILGGKNVYLSLSGEFHAKERENYSDIYAAFMEEANEWVELVSKHGVRPKFFGNFENILAPDSSFQDLRLYMKKLEDLGSKNNFSVYVQLNYSIEWAIRMGMDHFKEFPDINVIIRPTKGQGVPGQVYIPGKIQNYTFVYVQQGSCDSTWSLRQLVTLYLICLKAMVHNFYLLTSDRGKYDEKKRERMKELRELEAVFVNKDIYDKKLNEGKKPKVAVIFSEVGPERYIF
jgi:hypothetical protein